MLGKGLESLIPKNNNQGNDAPGNNAENDDRPAEQRPSSQRPQPQPRPSVVPPAQPVQPAPPAVRPVAASQQPQSHPPRREEPAPQESIFHIETEKITANPDQPRRHFDEAALHELANSIREFGFLQPLVVSKVEKETPTGIAVEYQVIAGERRFMAAKLLGLPRVPVIIRNINLEREKLELGVIENIQREDLNPIEMARAFQRLQEEFRMTQREIAAKLGKSREVVANAVRLLDLPEYVQRAVEEGAISESNARLLIAVEDPAEQKKLLDDIVENKLTTRDVRERVQRAAVVSGGAAHRRGRPPLVEVRLAPEVKALQEELSSSLGAPVTISKNANNGKITITFFSEEELKSILEKLKADREGQF